MVYRRALISIFFLLQSLSAYAQDVAGIGDSLTTGVGANLRPWLTRLPDHSGINFGVGGIKTWSYVDMAFHGEPYFGSLYLEDDIRSAAPDVIVIMLGTNDIKHYILHGFTPADSYAAVVQLLQRFQDIPRVLVAPPPRHSDNVLAASHNPYLELLSEQYAIIATQYGAEYVNAFSHFDPDGTKDFWSADLLHLSESGQSELAGLIAPAIGRVLELEQVQQVPIPITVTMAGLTAICSICLFQIRRRRPNLSVT